MSAGLFGRVWAREACLACCLAVTHGAHAQPASAPEPAPYPSALVDRPLVLPSGATLLDVSFEVATVVVPVTDAMGTHYERTGFWERSTPEFGLAHAFGPVDVFAGIGWDGWFGASVATGAIPARISLSARFVPRQRDDRYAHTQSLGVDHKIVITPHRMALYMGVATGLTEGRNFSTAGSLVKGNEVWGSVSASGELQLAEWFCVTAGPHASVPIYKSVDFDTHPGFGLSARLVVTTRKWDFYLGGSIGSVTHRPWTSLDLGFTKRWGL